MQHTIQKINREIRALAVPNVISNVSVPLISSVDTYLMGQLSTASLEAVGVGSMVFNFLYWNMGFLRMGTTGTTAQAYGRTDHRETIDVLFKAVFLGLLISALFILFRKPLFDLSSWAMDAKAENLDMVWTYFSIRILAAPASLLLLVGMGWLFGMQNARYPLWVTLFINFINIGVSYVLVRHFHWGVAGAAWGTVIAQVLGVLFCFSLIRINYRDLIQAAKLRFNHIFDGLGKLIRINQDIFLRTLFLSTAFVLIFRFSNQAGVYALAMNIIFMQFLNWMSYAIDGFAYAAESMVGKYKGANDANGIQLSIRWNMVWGFLFAVLFSITYAMATEPIFEFMMESDDGEVLKAARPYFHWMIIIPLLGFASYIWDGIFVGLTASRSMRNTMLLAFVMYLCVYFILPSSWGNDRIWFSFSVFLVARAAFQYGWYRWQGWEKIR